MECSLTLHLRLPCFPLIWKVAIHCRLMNGLLSLSNNTPLTCSNTGKLLPEAISVCSAFLYLLSTTTFLVLLFSISVGCQISAYRFSQFLCVHMLLVTQTSELLMHTSKYILCVQSVQKSTHLLQHCIPIYECIFFNSGYTRVSKTNFSQKVRELCSFNVVKWHDLK